MEEQTDSQAYWEKKIAEMSQEDMARLWRFAPSGHPVFVSGSKLWELFSSKFNGFNPRLSKKIGWDD